MSASNTSKKRKFVADGVFYAELNELLTRELAEDGYSGVEVRVTPMRTEVIIRATRTQNVLGEKGRRIRELTSVVQKRWNFAENSIEVRATSPRTQNACGHVSSALPCSRPQTADSRLLPCAVVRREGGQPRPLCGGAV